MYSRKYDVYRVYFNNVVRSSLVSTQRYPHSILIQIRLTSRHTVVNLENLTVFLTKLKYISYIF